MLVAIWYNPTKNSFYIKVVKSFVFDKYEGYENQFNHILIQLLFIDKDKFVLSKNFWDYHAKTKIIITKKKNNKFSFKNVLTDIFNK